MQVGFVLINCSLGTEEDTKNHVDSLKGVVYSELVFGDFDIIAKIRNESEEEFKGVIWSIRNFDTVISTVTILTSRD